jgi:hypothetical protein
VYLFNPPPGWPIPAEDWVPPQGWKPDPSWPPAPEGWQFWVQTEQAMPAATSADPWAYPDGIPSAGRGRSRRKWWAVAAAAVVVMGGVAAVAITLIVKNTGPELTSADAQRECRTAFESEFSKRENALEGVGEETVVSSLTGVELTDTWEDRDGISVNGVVKYDLTATLISPIHSTIPLTCHATMRDGLVTTTVSNRS